MEIKFWMVMKESGGVPTKRQVDKETAINEAQRLASKEQGVFYVLEMVGYAVPVVQPVKYVNMV